MAKKTYRLSPALLLEQRRAQRKNSRLRKQGASEQAISEHSPVRSAASIAAMTPRERYNYLRRLRTWNKPTTRRTVLPSGDLVDTVVLERTQRYADRYNERIGKQVERINKRAAELGLGTVEERQALRGYDRKTGKFGGGRGTVAGALSRIDIVEPPLTERAAKRRMERMMRASKRSGSERRESLRKSVTDMLYRLGDDESAERIGLMADEDFDALVSATNFMDNLALEYHSIEDSFFRGANGDTSGMDALSSQATHGGDSSSAWLDRFGVPVPEAKGTGPVDLSAL